MACRHIGISPDHGCAGSRLFGLLLFLVLTGVSADSLVPLEIDFLSDKARWIVRGRVLSKSCQRDPQGRIFTRVKLDVEEVWKGERDMVSPLTIVHGGGILGRYRSFVSNQVDYRLGEQVVVFLVRNSRGEAVTLGLCQGKFQIFKNPISGRRQVRNLFHGNGRADRQPLLMLPRERPLALNDLRTRVQGRAR